MKNVVMTLFLLAGLATTQALAQTCGPCPPCPPECCIGKCDPDSKACKDFQKAMKKCAAKCTPEQLEACKAAMSACATTQTTQTASTDITATPVSESKMQCQPACCNSKAAGRKTARQTALAQQ